MTQPVELPLARLVGNGVTTAFAANFTVFSLDDVLVELRNLDDAEVGISQGGGDTYDYVVNGNFATSTERYNNVTATFNTAPPTGYKIGLTRAGLQEQALDLAAGGVLPVESLERRFDRLVSLVQDLQAQINRAPLEPIGTTTLIDAGGRIVRNAGDPVNDQDLVTKLYLTAGSLSIQQIEGVTVNSYAALRALPVGGSEPVTAFVTGRVSIGDGGDGFYYYDASSTATDDGVDAMAPDSGGGRWLLDSGSKSGRGVIRKHKDATTSRFSTATPVQDPHLFGYFLDASATYAIDGFLHVSCSSATPDFKFRLAPSASVFDFSLWGSSIDPASTLGQVIATDINSELVVGININADTFIRLTGMVRTSAAIQMDLYWSQATVDAQQVNFIANSWLTFTKV